VILFDETIRQKTKDGTPFPDYLAKLGIIPGIKVDAGAKPLAGFARRDHHRGLDGLRERLARVLQARVPVLPSGVGSSTSARTFRRALPLRAMRRRWRAMQRCARNRTSFRSSNRKC
jgi:hypothetical protein